MLLIKFCQFYHAMGRKILHTGELGSASILKVITNYLASVNLVSVGEALTVAKKTGHGFKNCL